MRLIGISGKPGSNKMFYAFRIIQELRFHGYRTDLVSLAKPLYEEFNAIVDDKVSSLEDKAIVAKYDLGPEGVQFLEALTLDTMGERNPVWGYNRRNETVRKGLTFLGSEIRRKQNADYFLEKLMNNVDGLDFGVLIDLRFPNEADFINKEGLTIRIDKTIDPVEGDFKYSEAMKSEVETSLDKYDDFSYEVNLDTFDRVQFGESILDYFELVRKSNTQ